MTIKNLQLSLSSWLLFASLVCFSLTIFFLFQRITPVTLTFSNFPQTNNSFVAGAEATPASLAIPDLKINLPIFPGTVKNGSWPVSPKGLIHLSDTPNPGDLGNAIIYGHNWPNMLGPLSKAEIGQVITITGTNGHTQDFIIHQISTVSPYDIASLQPTDSPVLTLYTCTGFLDTQRLVITALPI